MRYYEKTGLTMIAAGAVISLYGLYRLAISQPYPFRVIGLGLAVALYGSEVFSIRNESKLFVPGKDKEEN